MCTFFHSIFSGDATECIDFFGWLHNSSKVGAADLKVEASMHWRVGGQYSKNTNIWKRGVHDPPPLMIVLPLASSTCVLYCDFKIKDIFSVFCHQSMNYTVLQSDMETVLNLICYISTANPPYSTTTSTSVNVFGLFDILSIVLIFIRLL